MAFAFLVGDADTAGANSFASVAQYTDHFPAAKGYNGDDLSALATADVQRWLVLAARMLAMVPWNGTTKYTDAAEVAEIAVRLPFPRYDCEVGDDADPRLRGVSVIDSDVVPGVVVEAQIELAEEIRIREADGERMLFRGAADRRNDLKSKRSIVGSSKTWEDPSAALEFPRVAALIRGLYTFESHPLAVAV